MKKFLIVLAALLTLAGAVLFTVALVGVGFDLAGLGTTEYETNTYTVEGDFTNIDVRSRETDVTFAPAEDGVCRVICEEREKVSHTVAVTDGTLKIEVSDTREWYDYITLSSTHLAMTVYLPAGAYETLSVSSNTGDVSLPADFSFEALRITASTGDVTCGASVTGKCEITASTGHIRLSELRAGEIALSVSTGDVDARTVTCDGALMIAVSTGDVKLTDVTCTAFSSTEGGTGSVTLTDVIAAESITVSRSTGWIKFDKSDAPEITVTTSTGDVTGTLRTGKTFTASSNTGDVRVPSDAEGGRCTVTTSTGDICVKIAE